MNRRLAAAAAEMNRRLAAAEAEFNRRLAESAAENTRLAGLNQELQEENDRLRAENERLRRLGGGGGGCPLPPSVVCSAGQYRTNTCSTCSNAVCPSGTQRVGSCSGTTNGYQCQSIPNVVCGADQFRTGANPGTCVACSSATCASGTYRQGSCSGTTNGYTCTTCSVGRCLDVVGYRESFLRKLPDYGGTAADSSSPCKGKVGTESFCNPKHDATCAAGSPDRATCVAMTSGPACDWVERTTTILAVNLAGFTETELRNAAAGKTATQGGLNKGDVQAALTANGIVFSTSESTAALRAKLRALLDSFPRAPTCPAGQYLDGTCGGTTNSLTCSTCSNTVCASGSSRVGSCGGSDDGYSCEKVLSLQGLSGPSPTDLNGVYRPIGRTNPNNNRMVYKHATSNRHLFWDENDATCTLACVGNYWFISEVIGADQGYAYLVDPQGRPPQTVKTLAARNAGISGQGWQYSGTVFPTGWLPSPGDPDAVLREL